MSERGGKSERVGHMFTVDHSANGNHEFESAAGLRFSTHSEIPHISKGHVGHNSINPHSDVEQVRNDIRGTNVSTSDTHKQFYEHFIIAAYSER